MCLVDSLRTSEVHQFVRNPFVNDILLSDEDAAVYRKAAPYTNVKCLTVSFPGQKYVCDKAPENVVKESYSVVRVVGILPGSLFTHGREVSRLIQERDALAASASSNVPLPIAA